MLVFIHFSQLLSFYRWGYYINQHSIYLLEANFAAKDLEIRKNNPNQNHISNNPKLQESSMDTSNTHSHNANSVSDI